MAKMNSTTLRKLEEVRSRLEQDLDLDEGKKSMSTVTRNLLVRDALRGAAEFHDNVRKLYQAGKISKAAFGQVDKTVRDFDALMDDLLKHNP